MAIETWSKTAGSNNATPPNGFPEGMAPGSVNDSAREVMAQVRRLAEQEVSASFATDTGAANAYAIAPAIAPTAYTTGAIYCFKAANANTTASTLNVASLGAKTIKKFTGGGIADVAAGDILAGQMVALVYDGTNMVMISPVASLGAAATTSAPGVVELATQAEVDTGTDAVRAITPVTLTGWTPAVGTVTLDPASDKLLIADASGSGVLKQALMVIPTATQTEMEAASSTAVYVTPGRQHFHPSAAKAWGDFTTTTVNSNYKASSIAGGGATGIRTVNLDVTLSSSNYAVVTAANSATPGNAASVFDCSCTSKTTTSIQLRCANWGDNGTSTGYADNNMMFAVFGDL